MLGLRIALSVAKKTLGDLIDGLLSTLRGRATYYENGSASKSTIKAIDNADVLDKATILLTPTATSDALVHSVKDNTSDSDFDFDRASSATRINSSGLVQDMQSITDPELVTDGDFPNGDNWNEGSSWTIADNKATATANGYLIQSNTFLALSGQTYSLTYTISNTNDASLQLAGGSNPFGATNLPRTNGTHTVYLTTINTTTNLQFYSNGFRGDLSNVSSKNITFSTDVDLARINYDSNGANGHILLEPTSTNFLPYSNDFSQSNWVKQTNITPTYNTTETLSPDGTYNATKLVGNGTDGIYDSSLSITGDVTRSVYLKSVSGTINVKLKDSNVDIGTETLTVTTEWQRFYLSGDNGTSSQGIWIDDIPLSGIYIFGAQVEALSYPTSYIPTLTGSTVTRAAETLTGSGNSTLINSTEGVLYAEIAALANDSTDRRIAVSDGTAANGAIIEYNSTSNVVKGYVITGSTTVAELSYTLSDSTDYSKVALKWKADDFALWVDGTERDTDAAGSVPSASTFTTLDFNDGVDDSFYGKCKALAVFNQALIDTELQNLTS